MAIAEGRLGEIVSTASINEILKKLDLSVDDTPKNAAVILFCKKNESNLCGQCFQWHASMV